MQDYVKFIPPCKEHKYGQFEIGLSSFNKAIRIDYHEGLFIHDRIDEIDIQLSNPKADLGKDILETNVQH